MHRLLAIILVLLLLTGCAVKTSSSTGSSQISSAQVTSEESSVVSSSISCATASTDVAYSKSSEKIYATNGDVTLGGKIYAVEVVQTEAIAPDMDKYPLCSAVGKFDLVVRDAKGNELHRQNLNELYDNKMIGYWGVGTIDEDKMNFLTNQEMTRSVFGVIVGHGQNGACIMFSLDATGELKVLPVDGGYAHSDSMFNHMEYGDNATINHFNNVLNGDEYVWDGSKFLLMKANNSPAKIVEGQNSLVSSGRTSFGTKQYTVEVMQTKYLTPDKTKTDCRTYGNFDVIVKDVNGNEVSRLGLNQFFNNQPIGLDLFDLHFLYNNSDSECIFGVRGLNALLDGSWLCTYTLLKLDESGSVTHVPVQDDYVFSTDRGSLMFASSDSYQRFVVDPHNDVSYAYTWNGQMYTRQSISKLD